MGLWRTVIKKETGGSLSGLGFATYLLTILVIIVFSYWVRPILRARYTIVITGLLVGSIAIGLAAVKRRFVFWGALLLWGVLVSPARFQFISNVLMVQ